MSHLSSIINLKTFVLSVFLYCGILHLSAQKTERDSSNPVVTNSFWDNWYGQFGVDMNLLFPHGHSKRDVFPNGKSFGISVGVGKWFSPEFGSSFKVNWNNGIFKNEHNTWLAPYGESGGNQRNGGFLTFIGDIQLNINNLLGEYNAGRSWNLIIAPRAGGWYDIGQNKGCPILGVGLINTYRLNDNWSVYLDAGYHFVASINGVESGKGHGSNGYAELTLGVQMDLSSESKFYKASDKGEKSTHSVKINSFWSNWFAQAGLGMSLINPYGTNFSNVFPNGKTFGINVGVGKWFTPEVGVRGGINWQNGIVGNKHATYLDSKDGLSNNNDKHGFASLYADLFLNMHNIISGYDAQRKWNTIVFPRMGIGENFSSDYKECPTLGLGIEQTYKLNDRLRLYADAVYQVTTGGFLDGKFGGDTGLSCNGWFDINIGVQYELGKTRGWKKVN